ncbi:MAG: monofunctional biosynthetic peptidoglycan transglycosylase [Vicinamibacterales bacterium]
MSAAACFGLLAYVYLTLPDVRPLARQPPGRTAWMTMRAHEAERQGRALRHEHRWVPYARISPHLKRAVIVAEDGTFWEHEGIDLEQIRESVHLNLERGRAARGASTITQQLAKNLYLSPSRNPIRKLRELILARRLEAALSKARILEIYLNVIEWGDGVWGAEAAARRYFGAPASALTPPQAALLAGAIVNPRALSPARPTARLLRRQQIIMSRMGAVTPPAVRAAVPAAAEAPIDRQPQLPRGDPPSTPIPVEPPASEPLPPAPAPPPVPCPVPPCGTRPPR